MNKNCYIFYYDGYVGIAPTIINLSTSLENQGYTVTIFATKNDVPQPKKLGSEVEILYFKKKFKIIDYCYKSKISYFSKFLEIGLFTFQGFSHIFKYRNYKDKSKFTTNVVVDFHGLMLGLLCYYFFGKSSFFFLWKFRKLKLIMYTNLLIELLAI